jgi:hypothetical protein
VLEVEVPVVVPPEVLVEVDVLVPVVVFVEVPVVPDVFVVQLWLPPFTPAMSRPCAL